VKQKRILEAREDKACSFERIYFSRGNDCDIYRERKNLGAYLAPQVLESIGNDLKHSVFSFVPNTAEVAYIGLTEALEKKIIERKMRLVEELQSGKSIPEKEIKEIISASVRKEKAAWKDIKLRTFIAQGDTRNDLAAHVYDITYESIQQGVDNLVIIDDSIVRGTTLKQSIIRILNRLQPRKIVIVSSSPQVRYPDCYGIDMSRLGEFIAFRAAMQLLEERGMRHIADEVYELCKKAVLLPKEEQVNHVKAIYAPFNDREVSAKICEMLTPEDVDADVEIVYQTIEDMHKAIPSHKGDWYFSGDYPTPGGNRLVNQAFINYYEGNINRR
jgi:amidophosphoribosyltransferase